MRRFEAYPSRVKLLGLFLLNIALVAGSAFCTTLPGLDARLAGWAGVVFFGLGLIVIPHAWFRRSHPRIVMDDTGIHTGSSIGLVEWDDITGFRVDSIKGTKFISVLVHDEHKYLDRMPTLARRSAELHPAMGLSEITLCFTGLAPGLEEACRFLQEAGFDVAAS